MLNSVQLQADHIDTPDVSVRRNQIYGFDLLKFLFAAMIIALHTKAFHDVDIIRSIMDPFVHSAVGGFFILSSFFLFKKMEEKGYLWEIWLSFFKRILKLYCFWFIVTLPLTLFDKWYYFNNDFFTILFFIIRDFFFSYTFAGSWFLSALVIGTLFVFLMRRYTKISSSVILLLAILLYIYLQCQNWFPVWLQQPYLFIQHYIRKEVNTTPLTGIVWCSIGFVLANKSFFSNIIKQIGGFSCWMLFIIFYVLLVIIPVDYKFILRPCFITILRKYLIYMFDIQ